MAEYSISTSSLFNTVIIVQTTENDFDQERI